MGTVWPCRAIHKGSHRQKREEKRWHTCRLLMISSLKEGTIDKTPTGKHTGVREASWWHPPLGNGALKHVSVAMNMQTMDQVVVLTFLLLLLCGVAHEEVLCWLLPSQGKSLNLQGTECCLQGWLGGVTLATFPNCRCLACLARNQPVVQLQLHGLWERLVPVQFQHICHSLCLHRHLSMATQTQARTETTHRDQHKKQEALRQNLVTFVETSVNYEVLMYNSHSAWT